MYSKDKNGFQVDYYDPYLEDSEFQQKLKNNNMVPMKRRAQDPTDDDYFQEFVDNTVYRQTQNMSSFFKYYDIPQNYYGTLGIQADSFRTVLPVNTLYTRRIIRKIRIQRPAFRYPTMYYSPQPMLVRNRPEYYHDYDSPSKSDGGFQYKSIANGSEEVYDSENWDNVENSSFGDEYNQNYNNQDTKFGIGSYYRQSPLGRRPKQLKLESGCESEGYCKIPLRPIINESEDELVK